MDLLIGLWKAKRSQILKGDWANHRISLSSGQIGSAAGGWKLPVGASGNVSRVSHRRPVASHDAKLVGSEAKHVVHQEKASSAVFMFFSSVKTPPTSDKHAAAAASALISLAADTHRSYFFVFFLWGFSEQLEAVACQSRISRPFFL